jgi:two-component system, sensor histidine kinase and response regulator
MNKPVILCVDDEQMLLLSLKQQLKNQFGKDYQIETAEDGEEALEIIQELLEQGIDLPLVISDQLMQGMKGDQLLTQIHSLVPQTFKILLTGQAEADAIGKAVNSANLYRYISKPWEPSDLNLTVMEAIRRYFHEKELSQFYASLEKKVADRTKALQQKNQFLSIAVHDLKNPLSAIRGYAEMIQTDLDDMPKAEILEVIDRILISSRQMFELILNLLEVNEIESGKMNLSLEIIDIKPVLQWLLNHYDERAKAKRITLQFHCEAEHYYALANENTTRQVFDNLISNAVKYSPYDKDICVRIHQEKNVIRCEIQDEGPGLSHEDQEKLFCQFTRLTPKPTGGEHSTGLGLFIVKKLVDSMQGNVSCQSTLGKGATFIVELPIPK